MSQIQHVYPYFIKVNTVEHFTQSRPSCSTTIFARYTAMPQVAVSSPPGYNCSYTINQYQNTQESSAVGRSCLPLAKYWERF